MLTTIMVYKFTTLSRREVEAMLGLSLQETRFYQEAKGDGERALILRLLPRRVGTLPEAVVAKVNTLSVQQLEALTDVLLDLQTVADLEAWLNQVLE